MEPLQSLISLGDGKGAFVGLLIIIIGWLYLRDKRSDERAETQHKQCEERNAKNEARIDMLEMRQFTELKQHAEESRAVHDETRAVLLKFMVEQGMTPPPHISYPMKKTV